MHVSMPNHMHLGRRHHNEMGTAPHLPSSDIASIWDLRSITLKISTAAPRPSANVASTGPAYQKGNERDVASTTWNKREREKQGAIGKQRKELSEATRTWPMAMAPMMTEKKTVITLPPSKFSSRTSLEPYLQGESRYSSGDKQWANKDELQNTQ
jgi:hypothetical protein